MNLIIALFVIWMKWADAVAVKKNGDFFVNFFKTETAIEPKERDPPCKVYNDHFLTEIKKLAMPLTVCPEDGSFLQTNGRKPRYLDHTDPTCVTYYDCKQRDNIKKKTCEDGFIFESQTSTCLEKDKVDCPGVYRCPDEGFENKELPFSPGSNVGQFTCKDCKINVQF